LIQLINLSCSPLKTLVPVVRFRPWAPSPKTTVFLLLPQLLMVYLTQISRFEAQLEGFPENPIRPLWVDSGHYGLYTPSSNIMAALV
jgi:hypothetical protein